MGSLTVSSFASGTGTSIATGLVPTAAEYQSQVTLSGVVYGLVKYTFSGSPDLSSVIAGHQLTAAGFTNDANNVTGFTIHQDADNVAKTITIRTVERLDNTLDETGITGTGSVASGGASRLKPTDSYIQLGFIDEEFPSAQTWNWLMYEMNQVINAVDSRAASIYGGITRLTSTSFVDLDGAGVDFAKDATISDQSWTASANDGAYEDFTGLNDDITPKGSNRALYISTWEQNSGNSRPVEIQLDINTGATTEQFVTSAKGYADAVAQKYWSHSFCVLTSALSSSTAYDFNTEAMRYTGLDATKGRSLALELHPTDDSGNALVRFASTGISEATLNAGSHADMTGYTTGAQTFQNGNKALVIAGIPVAGASAGANVRPTFKLLRDATDIQEWDMGSSIGAGDWFSNGSLTTGTMCPLARVIDVTGAHTIKMQGYYSTASTLYAADNEGYFHVIELPAQYNGNTLVRATADLTDFTDTSFAEQATSGNVTSNGHPVLMMISGAMNADNGGSDITATFKFQVDGVDVSGEYRLEMSNKRAFTIFHWVDSVTAGTRVFSVEGKTSAGTAEMEGVQFAAFEMPFAADDAGNAYEVTLTNTTGKKVEITYTGAGFTTSDAEVTFQVTENIDGGGAAADGNPQTYTLKASDNTGINFRTVLDAPANGSTVVYKLQAKLDSGTVDIAAGDFMAREIAADGS